MKCWQDTNKPQMKLQDVMVGRRPSQCIVDRVDK